MIYHKETGTIVAHDNDKLGTERLKYLERVPSTNGELLHEATSHISVAWLKWRSTPGVLFARSVNER